MHHKKREGKGKMANSVNLLLTARAVMAAVQHLPENGIQEENLGALQAMQDPAFTALRQAINPLIPGDDKSLAWVTKGGRDIKVPKVTITYKPRVVQTAISERTKQSSGVTLTDGASMSVWFDQHKEKTWQKTIAKELLEDSAQNYIRALLGGGKLSGGRVRNIDHLLSNLGYEMFGSMVPTIFTPANTYILSTLVAAIGKNKAYPTATTPTAAAPCIEIVGYDAKGNPTKNPRNVIMNTKLANKIQGKPILIGGLKWLQWHRDLVIYKVNQDGLDFVTAYANMPWVFYYDGQIDTTYGQDQAIMVDGGAVAFDSVNYHGPNGLITEPQSANTYFDRGVIRFNQFVGDEPGLAGTPGIMSMGFDVRIAEQNDTNDLPEQLITPSFSYGMYTRPTGFFTSDTGDVMNAVTGVYGFKLTDEVAV